MAEELSYVPKWHRELELFTQIKPLLILEGNVLDVYQYPVEGSMPKGSILRLPDYLFYHFKDIGYKTIIHYDSVEGFYNTNAPEMLEHFAKTVHARNSNGKVEAQFKSAQRDSAPQYIRRKLAYSAHALC